MQPKLELTPEEADALVADYEARSAHIAASCLPSVKAAARNEDRVFALLFVYVFHAFGATYDQLAAWSGEADARLAAIETGSRTLRRARAARTVLTESFAELHDAVPADFCAMVTAWQAKGWKGQPPGAQPLLDLFDEADGTVTRRIERGSRLLRRHGAKRPTISCSTRSAWAPPSACRPTKAARASRGPPTPADEGAPATASRRPAAAAGSAASRRARAR
ncbi:MAG TPA: hypothetical protein VK631_15485 [Solirubrobacteraceae bacterium]|nr:hypothetical protein [Solirubrobacteraceae bacterium]